MKNLKLFVPILLYILIPFLFIVSSCSKMNDTQLQFTTSGEKIYLGKIDSIQDYPGLGRVKLTWYNTSDPRIDHTVIYWNMRKDSAIVEFNRTTSGLQKDSVILDSLPEGTSLFEFKNIGKEGETSLYSSASVTVWGSKFADGLHGRSITSFDFNYDLESYKLGLSSTVDSGNIVYSQLVYTDTHSQEQTIRIEPDTNKVKLEDFPEGTDFHFRTAFFPSQGIDTIFSSYEVFNSPSAVLNKGTKLSLQANMTNQYFSREDSLFEWNANGDLNVYVFQENGSLTQVKTLSSAIDRNTYKYLFFYNADKFIGITHDDGVVMLRDSADYFFNMGTFGSSFHFAKYIPATGFFFSITAGTGEIRTWFAKNDATWGSPNGTTVGNGFDQYEPLMLFDYRYLLGVDENGYLWSMPVTANGKINNRRRIGSGWNRFKKIISVETQLLGIEQNGDIYLFDDFKADGTNFYVVDK